MYIYIVLLRYPATRFPKSYTPRKSVNRFPKRTRVTRSSTSPTDRLALQQERHNHDTTNNQLSTMCIMRTYETRGRTVVEPPPRRGNFTSHPPAGVMRLPREWRRTESISDDGRYVEYR